MCSCGEPLSTTVKVVMALMIWNAKTDPNYLKSTTRQYWTRFSGYFHWKTLFYGVFGIILNLFVSVWYYHFPFFSSVETQVITYGGSLETKKGKICHAFLSTKLRRAFGFSGAFSFIVLLFDMRQLKKYFPLLRIYLFCLSIITAQTKIN